MSASLVGSEMCIRDRAVVDFPLSPLAPEPAAWWEGSVVLVRWGRPETAVSYTHLTLPTICSV
eukprot:81122-Alexandrium_andersonii.AAC.1